MGLNNCETEQESWVILYTKNVNQRWYATWAWYQAFLVNVAFLVYALLGLLQFTGAVDLNERQELYSATILLSIFWALYGISLVFYWVWKPHGTFSVRHNVPIGLNLFITLLVILLFVITFFDWFGRLPTPPGTSVQNVNLSQIATLDPSAYARFIAIQAVTAANGVIVLFSWFFALVSFGHPELATTKHKTPGEPAKTPQ
jgi:hypothetical protein